MINSRGSEWHQWDLHLHTRTSYDYKYKDDEADKLLVEELKKNNIKAVAITDHFKIDSLRIKTLRELAPEIVFFPGIELRTDKGSTNIHIILIFSEKANVEELEKNVQYVLLNKAKSGDSDETIYWDYNDIVAFSKEHNGIISIHAGHKSNGLDSEINNKTEFKMAIKEDYSKTVDIFEVSKLSDIDGYQKYVFNKISERPVIICSDNHDPKNYFRKEKLWIKSNLTFEGLLQAIKQPKERVFVGEEPPKLKSIRLHANEVIDIIEIRKNKNSKNEVTWFNEKLELNPSLISIIGNKGSGKSALADILALIGSNINIIKKYGSFLTKERFDKSPEYFAKDYEVNYKFRSGSVLKIENISIENKEQDEYVKIQYLPQKYIEHICTELNDSFQQEINKVIYHFLEDKNNTRTLEEYIKKETAQHIKRINLFKENLTEVNKKLIELEKQKTKTYFKNLNDRKKALEKKIEEHETIKPLKVDEPLIDGNKIIKSKILKFDKQIKELSENKEKLDKKLLQFKEKYQIIIDLKNEVVIKKERIENFNKNILEILKPFSISSNDFILKVEINIDKYYELLRGIEDSIEKIKKEIEEQKDKIKEIKIEKENIVKSSNEEIKKYNKYLLDLEAWENQKKKLENDGNNEDNLEYINNKIEYILEEINEEYNSLINSRNNILKEIYQEKKNICSIYSDIYQTINNQLEKILSNIDSGISFSAFLKIVPEIGKISDCINKNYKSIFLGKDNCNKKIMELMDKINSNDIESIFMFINSIILGCKNENSEDWDTLNQVIKNKENLYSFLFGLDYINIEYMLTLNGTVLNKLSPGERGLVLLIFYLVLDKKSIPIIIDQPEDNLDNQSIYTKLVPCILEAKKRRQVILVTHNPNIAVACDSEQVIVAEIDKKINSIKYISGSIEDKEINRKIVEILEGTFPAFNLRECKYIK